LVVFRWVVPDSERCREAPLGGLEESWQVAQEQCPVRSGLQPTRTARSLGAEQQAHDLIGRRRGAIRHDERGFPPWAAIVNEATNRQHRRAGGRDKQDRIENGGELDRTGLHAPHRWAVRHMQGLIFRETAPDDIALPAELLDLLLQ
jgi:hypothetical protein